MALKEIVDQFFISIGLDTKQLDQGIDKAITGTRDRLKGLVTNAIAPSLAMLTSGALVNQFADEAVQLDRLSTSLGVNIEQLQAWQGAAEQAGVAGEEVGELFADLNDWMLDADQNQSGAMYEYIEKGLLPAVRNARGEMKSTEQYALEMADAFQAMGTQMATGLGRQIGISQAAMVGFLQQGSAKISADMQRIKEMGVYTKQDAEAAKELNKELDTLTRAIKGELIPIIRPLINWCTIFVDALLYAKGHIRAFIPLITALSIALAARLLPVLWELATAAAAFIFSPWGILLMALAALGLALDDFLGWLDGDESEFGEFWEALIGPVDLAKKKVFRFVSDCELAWEYFKKDFYALLDNVGKVAGLIGDIIFHMGKFWWDWFAGIYEVFQLVKALFNWLVSDSEDTSEGVTAAFEALKNRFSSIFDDMYAVVKNFWELVSPIFKHIDEALGISDKVKSALNYFKIGGALHTQLAGDKSNAAMQAIRQGDAGQAVAPKGITNNDNRQTSLDTKTTVNIYGSATREEYAQAEATANGINSSNIAQAVASQAGI